MKKKSVAARLGVLALALTLASTCLMGATMAKYTSTVEGTGSATVAKWSFKANEKSGSDTFTVALTDTSVNNKVADGKIAPGTDGSFNIKIDASGSETALDYTIAFSEVTNKPANLKFYTDASFATEITDLENTDVLNDSIALADVGTVVTKTVYWKWEYENAASSGSSGANDAADTADQGKAMTFKITVTGTQQDPGKA